MRLLLSSGRRPDSGPKRTPAFAGVTGDRIGASIAGRHISVCSLRLFDAAADTHARPQPGTSTPQDRKNHYFIPATYKTVHWGYFSKLLKPLIELDSGDYVTIEALTHHAYGV